VRRLCIATANRHKVREIGKILSGYSITLKQKNIPLVEPCEGSLEDVALEKARQAFSKLKKPVIAEDTGIYLSAYRKFPGIMAKRVYLQLGFEGLLALIKAKKNKKAHFKTVICFMWGKGKNQHRFFSGVCRGTLLTKVVCPKKDRLPYEKIFVPEGYRKAMVRISLPEKNKISHRAQAAHKLGKYLRSRAPVGS